MNISNKLIINIIQFNYKNSYRSITKVSSPHMPKISTESPASVKKPKTRILVYEQQNVNTEKRNALVPPNYRFIYPEFLPDPKIEWRNQIKEKLERIDMLNRRSHIDIPEFYVGTIMAVTTSDPHSDGKTNRFLGICIDRDRCGLNARFILRNCIDNQGMEVQYEMYDPSIQKIEVIRLEKRLDEKLFYLRDALPEYSKFDENMDVEILPDGEPVPINPIQVRLKPRPWLERWERQNLKGVSNIMEHITDKFVERAKKLETPWEKYDLVKEYRRTIPEEEQNEIYAEVHSQLHDLELQRKKLKRKKLFVKPIKLV